MNRLTTTSGECSRLDEYGNADICCPDENCDEGCLNLRIARLADYEDTGLEPAEIRGLISLIRGIRAYYKTTQSWDELFEDDVLAAIGKETEYHKASEVTENGQENVMGDG